MGRPVRAVARWCALGLLSCAAAAVATATPARLDDVRAVSGPAWLDHLGIPLESTRMGTLGGALQAARTGPAEPLPRLDAPVVAQAPFSITGADLYRFACRSCHGPTGAGAPPEIPSVITLVRGTSAALLRRRTPELSGAMARQLASETERSLRKRIRSGGVKMPAFEYLDPEEERALITHLGRMAGVPLEDQERTIEEPAVRVGELVVRGTCQICHGALPWRGPPSENVTRVTGVPSLSDFPRLPAGAVIRKVQQGDPGYLGLIERMPKFPYLTREEIIATILYLVRYPSPSRTAHPVLSGTWAVSLTRTTT